MSLLTKPDHLPKAELSDNARIVLAKRYLKKGDDGEPIEEPEDMFWRVAYTIAKAERKYGAAEDEIEALAREFYRLMSQGLFEPNSPTLMNAGRPLGQLSACFVLPVEDTISNGKNGIYDTLRSMAMVHQSGGGTGFSFNRLRPAGSVVRSTTGVASGPVSFMRLYDASTEVVKQGGTRRGANMGILRVDHPDIREFITCKSDVTQITNFNISVAVTDAFMEAVQEGRKYDLVDPRSGEITGQEDAREIFGLIIEGAWATGEPGVFFIDRANHYNPVPHLGDYEATNPCGEQPLLPYDVCNLGSINVGAFVENGSVQWKALESTIFLAVRFLDNVIDVNQYPLPEIKDLATRIRRIGLGVMGWADMLVRLGVPYNSEEGVDLGRTVMSFVDETARRASELLAEKRGVFPEWGESIWGPDESCARDAGGNRIRPMRRLRHSNITTVAPTGTISMIAGCSGGIEPLFAVAFMRNQAGELMPDVNEDFVRVAKEQGWYSEELMRKIAEEGHIDFVEVPEEVRRVFVTAHDVTPEWHVRMQAAFQGYVDSAISKTCNFPEHATKEDVAEIYRLAFELGCKGVTVYRDGSRPGQVLSTGTKEAAPALPADEEDAGMPQARPSVLEGATRRITSPMGELYVTLNTYDGRPYEVFATLGKAGGATAAVTEAMGRLISLHLRRGGDLSDVVRQLRGISSDVHVGFGNNRVLSMPDALASALIDLHKEALEIVGAEIVHEARAASFLAACAECGSEMQYTEGCVRCPSCGISECG